MTESDSEESAKTEAEAKTDAEAKEPEAKESEAKPSAEDDAAKPEDEAVEAPKRKKKRKRRDRASGARSELDDAGRERPAFLLEFPEDPELERLIRAFENGNYALVREDAPRLAERSADAAVKAAAHELLRRIEPDPLVKFLLGVAVALFCAVVGYVYWAH